MSVIARDITLERAKSVVPTELEWLSTPADLMDNHILHPEEAVAVGSYNHAMTQTNLGFLLKRLGGYSVFTGLNLDTSDIVLNHIPKRDEMRPDLCLYPKRSLSRPFDILKMAEMPLLAIEILSPSQGIQEILEKFAIYFACGVQSCWLVEPITALVIVYPSLYYRLVFSSNEVVDEKLGIRLPFAEIFE